MLMFQAFKSPNMFYPLRVWDDRLLSKNMDLLLSDASSALKVFLIFQVMLNVVYSRNFSLFHRFDTCRSPKIQKKQTTYIIMSNGCFTVPTSTFLPNGGVSCWSLWGYGKNLIKEILLGNSSSLDLKSTSSSEIRVNETYSVYKRSEWVRENKVRLYPFNSIAKSKSSIFEVLLPFVLFATKKFLDQKVFGPNIKFTNPSSNEDHSFNQAANFELQISLQVHKTLTSVSTSKRSSPKKIHKTRELYWLEYIQGKVISSFVDSHCWSRLRYRLWSIRCYGAITVLHSMGHEAGQASARVTKM